MLFLKRYHEIIKCDIKMMLVTLCFLVVGRATWSEFRRNQEQAHFWTPNELPRIIETMKGLNLCASEKSDAENDLEKSPWGHKCTLILPKIPRNRELRKGNSELFVGSGEILRSLKMFSVCGFTIKVKSR